MKQQPLSPKMLRQRKLLLALPLIVLPFLTLFFWALGGGKVDTANAQMTSTKGLNTQLPDAKLKDNHALNKMSYYDQATLDSNKLRQQMKSDPYYHQKADTDTASLHFPKLNQTGKSRSAGGFYPSSKLIGGNDPAANEAKVYQKLAQLQTTINKPVHESKQVSDHPVTQTVSPLKNQPTSEDPQLRQMNGLLETILDIQHPDRLKEKTDQVSDAPSSKFKAIPAVIDGKQKITQGSVVRIKLLDTVTLNGQLIPKGQLIYAIGNLYNQRLTLHIQNIRIGYTILPVDLSVFDMTDGLEGIDVPEAVTGDAVKDGAVSGVQGMEFMSLEPSITTQLAGAGLNTAKGLFSKKVKRVKAKLKDGHPLLLRDNKSLSQRTYK